MGLSAPFFLYKHLRIPQTHLTLYLTHLSHSQGHYPPFSSYQEGDILSAMDIVITYEKGIYMVTTYDISTGERIKKDMTHRFEEYSKALYFAELMCNNYDDWSCVNEVPKAKRNHPKTVFKLQDIFFDPVYRVY